MLISEILQEREEMEVCKLMKGIKAKRFCINNCFIPAVIKFGTGEQDVNYNNCLLMVLEGAFVSKN